MSSTTPSKVQFEEESPAADPEAPLDKETTSPEEAAHKEQGLRNRVLSKVSKQYDIDGDGHLDTVEFAMREMDQEGVGHLSNEKVYKIMREQIELNHKMFNMKRLVIGLVCLVALLAVSNLGTAWAAYVLAKDTQVDSSSGNLMVKGTNTNVAVVNANNVYVLTGDFSLQRRRLAGGGLCPNGNTGNTECYEAVTSQISYADVQSIAKNIANGARVEMKFEYCPGQTYTLALWTPLGGYQLDVMRYDPNNPASDVRMLTSIDLNGGAANGFWTEWYSRLDCTAITTPPTTNNQKKNAMCTYSYFDGINGTPDDTLTTGGKTRRSLLARKLLSCQEPQ